MSKVLVVSEDPEIAESLTQDLGPALQVSRTDWAAWNTASIFDEEIDLVLVDLRNTNSMPGSARSHILVEFKKLDAQMPVLFIANVDPVAREVIQATAEGRKMAFADPAEMSDPETVRQVVAALLPSENDHADISGAIAERDARQAFPHLVPNLRRPNSGRLDARRVADLYGFPLNRLATSVGADPTNVYKTPDAPSLQNKLLIFERIARSLLALVGSEQGLRIWLNTPEPELDGETPRDLLLNGEGEVVAELLEDIREGQPA